MKSLVMLLLVASSLIGQQLINPRHVIIRDTDPLYVVLGIKFDPVVRVYFQTDIAPKWTGVDVLVTFSDGTSESFSDSKFKEQSGWYTTTCNLTSVARSKTVTLVQVSTPPPSPVTSTVIALAPSTIDKTVVVDAITASSARVQWKTSTPVVGRIQYGLTPDYGGEVRTPSTVTTTNHVFYLSGLQPKTLFNFRVVGAAEQSSNFTFNTLAEGKPTPEAPRAFVDTRPPTMTGKRLMVDIMCTTFQAIINQASYGDTIALPKGTVCKGQFTFPVKQGVGWIVIETDGHALQPDVRLTSTIASTANLAKIQTTRPGDNAVMVPDSAHHYRFQALEIMPADETNDYQTLAESKPTSHHVIFDRVYFHGWEKGRAMRGVRLNGKHVAVINSTFDTLHWWDPNSPNGYGNECYAVIADAAGPGKLFNNFIDVPGISVFIGTGNINAPVEDWEVRSNHIKLSQRYMWSVNNPAKDGRRFAHRQLFETKALQRAIIFGNIFEDNFGDLVSAADSIIFSTRGSGGIAASPYNICDILISHNIVRRGSGGISIAGHNPMDYPKAGETQTPAAQRIAVINNLFDRMDGYKYTTTNVDGAIRSNQRGKVLTVTEGAEHITFEHNTVIDNRGSGPRFLAMLGEYPNFGLFYRNNIVYGHNDFGLGGAATNDKRGEAALNAGWQAYPVFSWTWQSTLVVDPSSTSGVHQAIDKTKYPAGTLWAKESDVGFVNLAGGDYRLRSDSIYSKAGTDGKDLGADIDALESAVDTALNGR